MKNGEDILDFWKKQKRLEGDHGGCRKGRHG